jgi:hypothetical protein
MRDWVLNNAGVFFKRCAPDFRSTSNTEALLITEALVVSSLTLELLDARGRLVESQVLATKNNVKVSREGGSFIVNGAQLVFAFHTDAAERVVPKKAGKLTSTPPGLHIDGKRHRFEITIRNDGNAPVFWWVEDPDKILNAGYILEPAGALSGTLWPVIVGEKGIEGRVTHVSLALIFIPLGEYLPKGMKKVPKARLLFRHKTEPDEPEPGSMPFPIETDDAAWRRSMGTIEGGGVAAVLASVSEAARAGRLSRASEIASQAIDSEPGILGNALFHELAASVAILAGKRADLRLLSLVVNHDKYGVQGGSLTGDDWRNVAILARTRNEGRKIPPSLRKVITRANGWSRLMVDLVQKS